MVNHISDAPVLDVLGDRTRRRLVALLAAGPRPAGDLARALRISRPAVSRHLRLLRHRGLVEERRVPKDGRIRLCRLNTTPLVQIGQWAEQVQRFWEEQLAAFADYVRTQEAPARRSRRAKSASRRHSR